MNGVAFFTRPLSFFKGLILTYIFLALVACGDRAPVITINGDENTDIAQSLVFVDPGATAADEEDGTVMVSTSGKVDTSKVGDYILTYTAIDTAGNSTTAKRNIKVREFRPFITTWKTKSENDQIIIYTAANSASFTVDWGDGNADTYSKVDNISHTYVAPGSYTVSVIGSGFTGINFSNISDKKKLVSIEQWGEVKWSTIDFAFYNCESLVSNATDFPDVSKLTDKKVLFKGSNTSNDDVNNWLNMCGDNMPVINFSGEKNMDVAQGLTFVEPGVTATDDVGGSIKVSSNGEVDTNTLGDYTLTYTAIDAEGNTTTATRNIEIREFRPFITTWKTDNKGESNDNQIQIISGVNSGSFTIDWGDNSSKTYSNERYITHTYDVPGIYTVSISGGGFTHFYSPRDSDNKKIIALEQWGDIQWSTMFLSFYDCENLISNALDIPDLLKVKDMTRMFNGASAFNADLSKWDVSSVENMQYMFKRASGFNGDVSNWDVSNVTNMERMFKRASTFNQDLSKWDVSNVTNMILMFSGATDFNGDVSAWDLSSLTKMIGIFGSAVGFSGDVSKWNVSNVRDMRGAFSGASTFNGDVSKWDTSSVSNISAMFHDASSFNGDVSKWDVSNVTDMSAMFQKAQAFNGDLSKWDTSSVTNMEFMFLEARAFNGVLNKWDVSNVTNMDKMFKRASAFNQDLNKWDTSNVTSMNGMFDGARTFNGDVSSWDVSNVPIMEHMFDGASAFNGDVSEWDVSSVRSMVRMFNYASAFDGDVSKWDVSNVTIMLDMFNGARAFNGDVSKWDVSNVTNMYDMFGDTSLSVKNYDALLQGWSKQNLKKGLTFYGGYDNHYSTQAQAARDIIVNDHRWKIYDGGLAN